MRRASGLRAVGLVLLTLLLCTCQSVKIRTVDLEPVKFATGSSGTAGSVGYCLSAGQIPPSGFSPGPGQVMVGFDDFFRPGSDPFPCDDLRALVFRAGVMFDLTAFDRVSIVTLKFDTASSIDRSNGETIGRLPGRSFATTLGVGTQPFSSTFPDDNEVNLPSGPTAVVEVDVSAHVSDWVTKVRPNFGFVISGPRGLVDPGNPPKDNDAQLSFYQNFRLTVIYNPDLNPRAPQ